MTQKICSETSVAVTSTWSQTEMLLNAVTAIKDNYSYKVRPWVAYMREHPDLNAVEGARAYCESLLEEKDGKRLSGCTANAYIAAVVSRLRELFEKSEHAMDVRERHQFEYELKKIKRVKINDKSALHKTLSYDDINKIIAWSNDKTVALFVSFLADTGCRISEAINVLLADIAPDRDNSEVVSIRVLGKGSKERRVICSRDIVYKIRRYCSSKKYLFEHRCYTLKGKNGKEYQVGPRFERSSISTRIRKEAKRILGFGVSAHWLWHSWTTDRLANGAPLDRVSKGLGHSSVSITSAIYDANRYTSEDYKKYSSEVKLGLQEVAK